MYIEFLSPMIYLPLILTGCEKIWKEKKCIWLVLSFAYAGVCNLYFLYMVCLFMVIYCITRCYFIYGGNVKKMFLACGRCIVWCTIGFVLSLPFSLPFILELLSSSRSSILGFEELFNIYNWIPQKNHFLTMITGWQPRYTYWSCIPIVMLIINFIFAIKNVWVWKHLSAREKQCVMALYIGIGSALLPVTYIIASGFSNIYDRYYFILLFCFAIVFGTVCDKIISDIRILREKSQYTRYIIILLCAVNIAVSGRHMFSHYDNQYRDTFVLFESCKMYVDSPVNYSKKISDDTSLYRISNDSLTGINGRPENVAMINDYNGLTFWFSVVNGNTQEIVNRLGTKEKDSWRSFGMDNNCLYESMAGVKYYLNRDNSDIPKEYRLIENIDFYDTVWRVYENPNVRTLIYAVDKKYAYEDLYGDYYAGNKNVLQHTQNAMTVENKGDIYSAEFQLEEDSQIVFAVPFDSRWKAYIDDVETAVYKNSILYLAIDCNKGYHQVRFVYDM